MRKFRWAAVLLAQLAAGLVLSYLGARLIWIDMRAYDAALWAVLPALGAVSGYLATRGGLNNYVAWIAPGATGILGHYLATFYLPETPGPAFVCALLSIIGAAAGEVRNRQTGNDGGRRDGDR